jgi:hypothetical protein
MACRQQAWQSEQIFERGKMAYAETTARQGA